MSSNTPNTPKTLRKPRPQTRNPVNAGRRRRYARLERWLYYSAVGLGVVVIGVIVALKVTGVF